MANRRADFVAWVKGPWGQLILYLLAFLILGIGVGAFFKWVRGPVRPNYTPFHEDQPVPAAPLR